MSLRKVAQERPRSAGTNRRHSLQQRGAPRDAAALPTYAVKVSWTISALTLAGFLLSGAPLRTADQKGYTLYSKSEYTEASQTFVDSYWRAIVLYRTGDFKQAAGIFAGYDTSEGCFNHGNALLFQGNYTEAAQRYERALEHRSNWEAAQANRAIALARAEALNFQGANMTDGKIGADDFVINDNPSQQQNDTNQSEVIQGAEMSDAELRAVWLRQVQTDPADFLKSKFRTQLQQQGGGN